MFLLSYDFISGTLRFQLRQNSKFREDLSFSERISNVPSIYMEKHRDKEFDIPMDRNGTIIIRQSTNSKITIREARNQIRNYVKLDEGSSQLKEYHKCSEKNNSYENYLAYQLSLTLQHIALSIFTGAIPIGYVLSDASKTILEDWIYCYKAIEKIRNESSITSSNYSKQYFEREHAEWLVCVAYLWLTKRHKFLYKYVGHLKMTFSCKDSESLDRLLSEREKVIRKRYCELLSPSVKLFLDRSILNINWREKILYGKRDLFANFF